MKMIEGCTLLITPYAIFMIIFHVLLHNLIRSVLDFVYHQYGIYRMYSGMKFHTFYKSHLSVWEAFQGTWSCGAWASFSWVLPSFFSCCKTDRTLPHPNICYADARCQAHSHENSCDIFPKYQILWNPKSGEFLKYFVPLLYLCFGISPVWVIKPYFRGNTQR